MRRSSPFFPFADAVAAARNCAAKRASLGWGLWKSYRVRGGDAARVLDSAATLDDLREAVVTLEDVAPTARRVLGGTHPTTMDIETCLRNARAALRARETPPTTGES